jgi:SGNH domain (fused to AT3 domains)
LNHNINWQLHDERVEAIRRGIKQLKQAVEDVVILGPSPLWAPDLPTAVVDFWTANKKLPDRMQPAPKGYHAVDAVLATVAAEQGARFISMFDQLCNLDGCLTHTPSSRSDLLSWDHGHLTTLGAHFVLEVLRLN